MMKYYIPEINLRDIRNKNNVIKKFEDVYNKEIIIEKIIISIDGFYKIEKEEAIKYKFIEKEYNYQSNFLNNYSLIGIDCYEKKNRRSFFYTERKSINKYRKN